MHRKRPVGTPAWQALRCSNCQHSLRWRWHCQDDPLQHMPCAMGERATTRGKSRRMHWRAISRGEAKTPARGLLYNIH
eukprot:9759641-Lingulodinium_polyedra.AAC.1